MQLRTRLVSLQNTKTLVGWLEQRPQLGHDVFAHGRTEMFGVSVEAGQALDVVAFLWASLALFNTDLVADTTTAYRPELFDLYPVAEARERILRVLSTMPEGASLETLLPVVESTTTSASRPASHVELRRRFGWSSTFVTSLELARQGRGAISSLSMSPKHECCFAGLQKESRRHIRTTVDVEGFEVFACSSYHPHAFVARVQVLRKAVD